MNNHKENAENESNLMVCVRIRPMSVDEQTDAKAERVCLRIDDKIISLVAPKNYGDYRTRIKKDLNKTYIFDRTFDESCSQEDVFEQTTSKLVEHVANGYNATVFASGATGAGKTHTMVGTDSDPGIMVRAMEKLFSYMSTTSEEYKYQIKMAYMELYNELLRDLLMPGPEYLELREDSRGIRVVGLHEMEPVNRSEVFYLLHQGNMNRTTEPTAANKTSSRSHAILQITVHQLHRVPAIQEEERVGKLFLVDLAGSERASKTLNRGKRMTEGAHINRSLLALGNCINALSDAGNRRYVNYRDSKLTRLLKDALAGNCKTVMIAHLSPSSHHFEETCNTLAYADRAKGIKTKIRRNVLDVKHHISEYTRLIDELREEIVRLKSESHSKQVENQQTENDELKEQLIQAQREHLKIRYQLARLRNQLRGPDGDETACASNNEEWLCSTTSSASLSGNPERQKFSDETLHKHLNGAAIGPSLSQQDLNSLQRERARLELSRKSLERSLDAAQNRVHVLQRTLAERQLTKEEREIIHLLCRLHEVEVERADLSGRLILNANEIESPLAEADSQLSEAIIRYQATLLADHHVRTPKELERLLLLYEQQPNTRRSRRTSIGSSIQDVSVQSNQVLDGMLSRTHGTSSPDLVNQNGDSKYLSASRLLGKWHFRRASDADTDGPRNRSLETRIKTPSVAPRTVRTSGEAQGRILPKLKDKAEGRNNVIASRKRTPLINRPTPPSIDTRLRPNSLENVRLPATKTNQRTRSSKPTMGFVQQGNRTCPDGLRTSPLSRPSQAIPGGDRPTWLEGNHFNTPRRPYELDGTYLGEQRKQSLRKLNIHLGRSSQDWTRDWAGGPLTRPIKVVPVDMKCAKRVVPDRTHRTQPSSSRSRIPRSLSSPLEPEDDTACQFDNLDSLKPIKELRRYSTGKGTPEMSGDVPLQQTTAVVRSNQLTAYNRRK